VEWGTRASVYIPGVRVGSLPMARIHIRLWAGITCAGALLIFGAVLLGVGLEAALEHAVASAWPIVT
jgi:hypothetical protein